MAMTLHPLRTKILVEGDNLVSIIIEESEKQNIPLEDGDVIVIASKAVARVEGRMTKLENVKPSEKAHRIAKKTELEPEFVELVIRESEVIYGGVFRALLTLKNNILQANAGIDSSNVPEGCAILLPENSTKSAHRIRNEIHQKTGRRVGVIIADSRTQPLRLGTTGFALGVAGIKPVIDERGRKDIYGKPLRITRKAVADNLACAAEILMGEGNEQTPVVIVKGAPTETTEEYVDESQMIIPREECMYFGTLFKQATAIKKVSYTASQRD
nr:coenzyme F420-0:L-glutamate ligase [Candidatus Sigynarchaeota archaeon]